MLINIRQGLSIPIDGAPEQSVHPAHDASRVAVLGADYPDLRPSLCVGEGDQVRRGERLFTDRAAPSVCITAPASGCIAEINRGPRRSLASIVIERNDDPPIRFVHHDEAALAALDPLDIRAQLLACGLWTSFRVRPRQAVPPPDARPVELFVTAIDTNPLAADPRSVIAEDPDAFRRGLWLVSRLTLGTTYLCSAPGDALPAAPESNLVEVMFAGPHPAGLPGTHMHHLGATSTPRADRWHIGYQDVMAIGHLFRTGELPTHRIVALGGSGVLRPRLVRALRGADIGEVLMGEVTDSSAANSRVICGSPLTGSLPDPTTQYLGAFHNQVCVMQGHDPVCRQTGMLPLEAFERLWPFDVPPLPLLRALLIKDTETAVALGCLDLDPDDLALCSYLCPARLDYGAALLDTLNTLERSR